MPNFRSRTHVSGLLTLVALVVVGIAEHAGASNPPLKPLCSFPSTNRFVLNPHPAARVDPLTGARFFLDGPGSNRGEAATAIAQQVGAKPDSFGNVTWSDFESQVNSMHLSASVGGRVKLLEKIGSQPVPKVFSIYSAGGGPGAIYSQVQQLLCRMQAVEPGTDALIATSFLNHSGACLTQRDTGSLASAFRRHVDELAQAIGGFPTVLLLEVDAIDSAFCLSPAGLQDREALLQYAITKLSTLPHTVIYVDGGSEDVVTPQYAARILNRIGINKVRGFFVNGTHYNWTIDAIKFGAELSHLAGGAHFVVGTQTNGRGPRTLKNGAEDACNPPGRGLGPKPATSTGYFSRHVDAFMWTRVPGRSIGRCHPGDAPPGAYDTRLALALARNANAQLGPHARSRPY